MPDFIYLIHPLRDGFFENPTEVENIAMEEHYQYLKAAVQVGVTVLAGPCLDQTFGLVVFQAQDEASARDFMMKDPSIQKNIMMAELHPFKISLLANR
jgi:uncharacterized protein YciI